MKTIGLIGGMSWESSARYYKLINEGVRDKLGELHSADIVMHSMDFYELERLQKSGEWQKATSLILTEAKKLEKAWVDFIAICSVTGHEGAERIKDNINIPLLHIAGCINKEIEGIKKIGLLGTIHTMEMDYFKKRINAEVIIPKKVDRQFVSDVIYNEISQGILYRDSKKRYMKIINNLDCEGVILGCTEIGLLIKQRHCDIPIFDSTKIHSKAIVDYACSSLHNL